VLITTPIVLQGRAHIAATLAALFLYFVLLAAVGAADYGGFATLASALHPSALLPAMALRRLPSPARPLLLRGLARAAVSLRRASPAAAIVLAGRLVAVYFVFSVGVALATRGRFVRVVWLLPARECVALVLVPVGIGWATLVA